MKYWEIGEKNKFGIECYKLHLKLPYGDEKDKVVAGFVQDENNNKYICVSDELNKDISFQWYALKTRIGG